MGGVFRGGLIGGFALLSFCAASSALAEDGCGRLIQMRQTSEPPPACRSLAGVALGDAWSAVLQKFGQPAARSSPSNENVTVSYLVSDAPAGGEAGTRRGDHMLQEGLLTIRFVGGRVVTISSPGTDEQYAGVRVGDPARTTTKVFGAPTEINRSGDVYFFDPYPIQVIVNPDSGRVDGFVLSKAREYFSLGVSPKLKVEAGPDGRARRMIVTY